MNNYDTPLFPRVGLVALRRIIGDEAARANRNDDAEAECEGATKVKRRAPRRPTPPFIDCGKTKWYEGVKEGYFPPPVYLGPNKTMPRWHAEDCWQVKERGVWSPVSDDAGGKPSKGATAAPVTQESHASAATKSADRAHKEPDPPKLDGGAA